MKKEEIIKNLIGGQGSYFTGDIYRNLLNGYEQKQNPFTIVDLDKLAKFLAKYVVKDKLVED